MSRRHAAVLSLCTLAALLAPRLTNAQEPAACKPADAAPRDSATLLLVVSAQAFDPAQRLPNDYAERVANAVARRLVIPASPAMRAYVGHRMPWDDATHISGAHLDIDAVYGVTLLRGGRLEEADVVTTSLDPALDSAVLAAVRAADAAQALPSLPDGVPGDSIPIRVFLAAADSGRARGILVQRLRVPIRRFNEQAALAPGQPQPPYPAALHEKRIEGRVDVSFVVGESGTVLPRTLSVRHATDPGFLAPVVAVVSGYRFTPARVAGCVVPTRVAMPFLFSLRP